MEEQNEAQNRKQINYGKPRRMSDMHERGRILAQYAGIFPHSIKQFAATILPQTKKKKNFAK